MKWDNRTPCASCPYRRDVPVGTWHVSEFQNLLANDRDERNGRTFACHRHRKQPVEERHLCVGWFLDQQRRGTPSLMLRLLALRGGDEAAAFWREAHDGGHDLYDSLDEMCEANGATQPRYKSDEDMPDGWKDDR